MKKSPLRKRSKKLAGRLAILRQDYDAVFSQSPICAWCGGHFGTEPHHVTVKRRQGDGLWFWLPLCKRAHDAMHNDSFVYKTAKEKGFIDCRWENRWDRLHPVLVERLKERGL